MKMKLNSRAVDISMELTAINGILFSTCTAEMPQVSVEYLAGRHLSAELEAQLEQRKKELYKELEKL